MATLPAIETALLTTSRGYLADGLPLFGELNSALDDWKVIDSSSSPFGLVVEMGGETLEGDRIDGYGSHGAYQERHQLRLTVTARVGTGASGVTAQIRQLKTHVEGLKDHLRGNRRLGLAAVRDLIPVRTSPVLERVQRRGEAPTHLLQQVTLYIYAESELE